MGWDAYHRREKALQVAVRLLDRRRDGELPWDDHAVRAGFEDPTELLLALQMRWHTRLSAEVERELAEQPLDLDLAVATAWREAAAALPGARAALDAYEGDPALATAEAKELGFLASAAGLAEPGDPNGVPIGRRIRDEARDVVIDRQRPASHGFCWISRMLHARAV